MSEFTATPTQRYSRTCPLCNSPTSSLHSHYTRHPTDLPISEHAIRLTLNVRRFRCRNTTCQRRIFNERLPEVIAAQARKTIRLREWIAQVGLELGGEAGFRILNSNAVQTSADTILRTVLSLPMSKVEVPKAIGIDEFFLALHQHLTGLGRAFKRGHTYGTVIVNLETGKPIDLLPDREVATVTRWLEEHPGAQFVARDRSTGFAEAISKGAPEAQQVLDRFLLTRWHLLDPKAAPGGPGSLAGRSRWHVLKNLFGAFEHQLKRTQKSVDEISQVFKTKTWLDPFQRSHKELEAQQIKLEKRRVQCQEIRALHNESLNISTITRKLGVSRWHVYQAIKTDAAPEARVTKRRASNLDPWLAFLKLRWDQGVHNAKELWQELRAQGYSGSHAQVMRWARLLKDGGGSETTKKRLTARQLVWVLLKEPEIESSDRSAFIGLLETAIPKIAAARQLVLEFLHGLREKNAGILEVWFATAKTNSELVDLQAFAVGLERDRSALEAAFTLAWSNGPTEGAVTRIKLIKRQGYGRAGFALLRRRVLLVA